jgi:hypothetical protein
MMPNMATAAPAARNSGGICVPGAMTIRASLNATSTIKDWITAKPAK